MIDKIKRDTYVNWSKAINFIPKENEVIIYDCENGTKIKIGDGKTSVIDLPFIQDEFSISNITDIDDETVIIEV